MPTAKVLMGEVITKLNEAGFTGGFYHYQKRECSCCFGLKDTFFQINENVPENWAIHGPRHFFYQISYNTNDKAQATEFRKIANKLTKKAFGKMVETAKSNAEAIVVNIY
jgi:hypothetical protein